MKKGTDIRYLTFGQFITQLLTRHGLKQREIPGVDEGVMSRLCNDIPPCRGQRVLKAGADFRDKLLNAGNLKLAAEIQDVNANFFRLYYILGEHPYKYLGIIPKPEEIDLDASKIFAILDKYPKGSPQRTAIAEAIIRLAEVWETLLPKIQDPVE